MKTSTVCCHELIKGFAICDVLVNSYIGEKVVIFAFGLLHTEVMKSCTICKKGEKAVV